MTITEFLEARISEDEDAAPNGFSPWALAECEAKRLIVEAHPAAPTIYPDEPPNCVTCNSSGPNAQGHPCATLRALASVYADHPDFDPAWAL